MRLVDDLRVRVRLARTFREEFADDVLVRLNEIIVVLFRDHDKVRCNTELSGVLVFPVCDAFGSEFEVITREVLVDNDGAFST